MAQEILHRQGSNNCSYIVQPQFEAISDRVFHGFFKRRGGVSEGLYASLNCGVGSHDDADLVAQNRALVAETSGCKAGHLLSLYQIHSAECLSVEEVWSDADRPKADAFVTDRVGIALGILTADCGPVLFQGCKSDGSPVIGAAHSGWGGAIKGVLEATIENMVRIGTQKDSIHAAIGPCIAQSSYEVQGAFADAFMEEDETAEKFFMAARKEGHLMFDLAGYCAFRLARAGLRHVSIVDLDTYTYEEDFFSYRRATHRQEADYGRQISVIAINESE